MKYKIIYQGSYQKRSLEYSGNVVYQRKWYFFKWKPIVSFSDRNHAMRYIKDKEKS